MQVQLQADFEEVLEPLGNHAMEFFLAASLYHAHKVSFSAAAAMAGMSFEAFLARLQAHFDTGFILDDQVVEEDISTANKIAEKK